MDALHEVDLLQFNPHTEFVLQKIIMTFDVASDSHQEIAMTFGFLKDGGQEITTTFGFLKDT